MQATRLAALLGVAVLLASLLGSNVEQASSVIFTGAASSGDNVVAEGCYQTSNPCNAYTLAECHGVNIGGGACGVSGGRCVYTGSGCSRFDDKRSCNNAFTYHHCLWYECIDNDRDGYVYDDGSLNTKYCTSRTGLNKPKDCDDGDPNVRACRPGQKPKPATVCTDSDSDGYGAAKTNLFLCQYKSEDCDDIKYYVNPGAKEDCDNNMDDDCDKAIDLNDNDCADFCVDKDGDGYGAFGTVTNKCRNPDQSDCDDSSYNVNPGRTEEPDNGKDDDCDASTPDVDFDKDGYASPTDCNDKDASIKPNQLDFCDGVDSDCDGSTSDEDCFTNANCGYFGRACYADRFCAKQTDGQYECVLYSDVGKCALDYDNDGYCGSNRDMAGAILPDDRIDCDDKDSERNPSRLEYCSNVKDDDCDGQFDAADKQGCTNPGNVCIDDDKDGAPMQGTDLVVCGVDKYDCADGDPNRSPFKSEICDGIDNDCDGIIDGGLSFLSYECYDLGADRVCPGGNDDIFYRDLVAGQKNSQGVCSDNLDNSYVSCIGGSWQWDYAKTAAQHGWTYETEEGIGSTAACNDNQDNDCDGLLDCWTNGGESNNGYCNDYCALLAAQTEGQTGGTQRQGQGGAGSSGGSGSGSTGGTGEAVNIPQQSLWDALLAWLYGR